MRQATRCTVRLRARAGAGADGGAIAAVADGNLLSHWSLPFNIHGSG